MPASGALKQRIVAELTKSYWMEIETVLNYIANSIHLDGVRAEEIKKSLTTEVQDELLHATTLGNRIKELGGSVPGSMAFKAAQKKLQPPKDQTDVVAVIEGVIAAEESACDQYNRIIGLCEGKDYVTQDICIRLLTDEEHHLRIFKGFLKEYKKGR
jgi:bacterioferritin